MNISYIASVVINVMAVLIALTVHEYAHALAANFLGDDTAKNQGRLSLNPLKHLDPIGAICMLLFRIGWAKPVPINARNFKNPKTGFAITALAGPVINILLSFVFFGICRFVSLPLLSAALTNEGFLGALAGNLRLFLLSFAYINVGLGVFNLLPIPPFDGSRLLNVILPPKIYFGIMKYEQYIYYGVLAWLLLGDYVAMALMSIPLIATNPILSSIAGIFSLSDMISFAIEFISELMINFWLLF